MAVIKLQCLKTANSQKLVCIRNINKYGMIYDTVAPKMVLYKQYPKLSYFASYKEDLKYYSFTFCKPKTIYYLKGERCIDSYNINSPKDRSRYIKYSTLKMLSKCNSAIALKYYKMNQWCNT